MVLCNPQNPTGVVVTRPELEALADLAAEHEAWILSDEIHAPLILPGAEHIPFVSVSDRRRGPGHHARLGLEDVQPRRSRLRPDRHRRRSGDRRPSTSSPFSARHCGHLGAIATEAAYADGDAWLDAVLEVLDHNRRLLGELLGEHLPDAAYEPRPPDTWRGST